MDLNDIKVDDKKISTGEWVGDLEGMGDIKFLVKGMTAPDVEAYMALKLRALTKKDRDRQGRPSFSATIRVTKEVLVEKVLLDWANIVSNGEEVPYSKEMARTLICDDKYKKFADAISAAAAIVDNGNSEATEDISGN